MARGRGRRRARGNRGGGRGGRDNLRRIAPAQGSINHPVNAVGSRQTRAQANAMRNLVGNDGNMNNRIHDQQNQIHHGGDGNVNAVNDNGQQQQHQVRHGDGVVQPQQRRRRQQRNHDNQGNQGAQRQPQAQPIDEPDQPEPMQGQGRQRRLDGQPRLLADQLLQAESSLAHFKQLREHFRSCDGPDRNLCTAASRPRCVSVQYNNACTNLKDVYDKLKEYHDKAEEAECSICVSTTMLACSSEPERSEYELQFPRPLVHHSPKQRRRRPMALTIKKSPRPHSEADILEDYFKRTRSPLPTPEEVMRQNVTPSSVIPIDVTGSGFERMASFRRSATPTGKKERKKRRSLWRRTITGIPDAVQHELNHEQGWRSDTSISEQASSVEYELKTQSLDRRSFRKHQRSDKDRCTQDIAVVTPMRARTRKARNSHHHHRTSAPVVPQLAGTSKDKDNIAAAIHDKQAARLSLPLEKLSSVNGSNDSSLDRVWMASSPVRPKSLEFTAQQMQEMGPISPPGQAPSHHTRKSRISTHFPPAQTHHHAIPNAIIPTMAVTRTINTQRTTMSGNGHEPLPNGKLPNSMHSATVKLRESKSGAKKEDRHSSSGNWSGSGSGTDSTRTSVNSDVGPSLSVDGGDSSTISPSDSAVSLSTENVATVTSSAIHDSLQSVDSALGNGTVPRPHKLALPVETTSDLSGSPTPTNSFSQIDTENWLKTIGNQSDGEDKTNASAEEGNVAPDNKSPGIIQIGFPDNASDSSSSENPSSSQNLSDTASIDLEVYLGDGNSFDSDSLSSFSVDTEGYWTSMHSDCGLPKRGKGKPSKGSSHEVAESSFGKHASVERGSASAPFGRGGGVVDDKHIVAPPKPKRKQRVEPPSINVQQSRGHDGNGKMLMRSMNTGLLMVPEVPPASASSTDTDSASEASYDLSTPGPIPPDNPAMYKLCYSGSNSSVDSQRSNRPHTVTSSQSLDNLQSHTGMSGRKIDRQSSVPPILSPSSSDSGVHIPVSSPTGGGFPPRPPMIPLGQMTVNQAQQQKLQSELTGKLMIFQSAKESFLSGNTGGSLSTIPGERGGAPVSSPTTLSQRVEMISQRSPMSPQSPLGSGMYPEKYNTLQRRTRIQAGWEAEKSKDGDLPDTAQLLMSPTAQLPGGRNVSPQDRQQLFQDYVNTLQSQAPQNYSSIGGLADYCNGRQGALTREQRAEILDLMRRSKHSRPATSPIEVKSNVNEPTSQNSKASFRSSYHEGIESGHLDPDMAIIHAADQLEQNRTEIMTKPVTLQPLKTNLTSPEGDLPFVGPTPTGSPKIIPDEPRTPLYIFDPNRQPKNGILKAKKKASSDELEAKIHNAKKKMNIKTDPFAKTNRPTSPSEGAAGSLHALNTSSKSITFSDTVHVDYTPVKVCSVSGKPQTSIDDFKALLQQRQRIFRPFNATERLSSAQSITTTTTANTLPNSRLDAMLAQEEDGRGTPERRIVTMFDLRNAMANPRSSTRTNDLRLPYQQLQISQKASNKPVSPLTKEGDSGAGLDKNKNVSNVVMGAGKPGYKETDLRFLSPDDGEKDNTMMEIMAKMDEDEKDVIEKMEKEQKAKGDEAKADAPKPKTELKLNTAAAAALAATTVVVSNKKPEEAKVMSPNAASAKQVVSPQDDPTRKKLLESIRERGQRKDSRQEAIKMLEALKTIHEKPDLTIEVPTPTDGTISTLLDNMKTQIPQRFPESATSPNTSEHEYGSDAWD